MFISKFLCMYICIYFKFNKVFLIFKFFFNFIWIWIIVVRRYLIGFFLFNCELFYFLMDVIIMFVLRCVSMLKFDFLWDKMVKMISSNVRVIIVYFVIYCELYIFIFFFKIDIYLYIWKLKYIMLLFWCVFWFKNYVKWLSCYFIWWYSYYILFWWVKIKCFNVLFVWFVDNNFYVRNYCKFYLLLMIGMCIGWCLLFYKLVVLGLFKINDWLRNDYMFIEIKEYIYYWWIKYLIWL